MFRKVGVRNSDARELVRRKHRTFRTRRKFEIKKTKGFVKCFHRINVKMEETEYSETSAYKFKTPGNYPEESIQN